MFMNSSAARIDYIDVLRGVALILALEQHIGVWLTGFPYSKHLLLYLINGFGGFGGPLFVTLAGVSAYLFTTRNKNCDSGLVKRGLTVLAFGYVLNLTCPYFFNYGSWFVLHMIGFGILVTPLIRRLSSSGMIVSALVLMAVSVALHNWLNTPYNLYWSRQNDMGMTGGIVRLMFVEGHFPVLPWISYFIGGVLAGKLLVQSKVKELLILAIACFVLGGIIAGIRYLGLDIAETGPFHRIFRFYPGFYPAGPFIIFTLYACVIVCLLIFRKIGEHVEFSKNNPLITLGHTTMTFYMGHFIIGGILSEVGMMPKLSAVMVLPGVISILIVFAALSLLWSKINYKYGPEWIMRKIV